MLGGWTSSGSTSNATRIQFLLAGAIATEALGCLSQDQREGLAAVADRLLSTITEKRLNDRDRGHIPAGGWLCRLCDFTACGRPSGACPALVTAQAHQA
jgi:hypothetical protein